MMTGYFGKMGGATTTAATPTRAELRESLISGLGATLAIGACSFLSLASGFPWLTAPFGATCALVFGAHKAPLAQPRNVVGGYVVSALAGLITQALCGYTWWSLAVGVGLAIAGMIAARVLHPPAGGVPIVILTAGAELSFLVRPVFLGACVVVLVAVLYNNLFRNRRYPEYW